ncbi:MATH and LRR domain-containing protein PFE0570w-like [Zerene cesonia]|uniref:MATH and LRR domain-containing protein PFE0570w-like n=1 Tax=Zerene cesonia TaxID=33412 RepID=UPI0018E56A06|nr:MATH and LRR domain-containing protein PFE0570w-like [Zerene cesonia]
MSDSEDDILPNNVITFQNENTTISAQGPGINKSNMTGFSFRSNVLTSTLNMGGNTHRHRFGNPQYDQRSMYHGRETSPMSMRSDFGPRNFQNSYYSRAMSSQRSLINGRSGSPLSVRSIDTTASVSAMDIANAFKYMKFNNHELRIIKDAYQKLMRNKVRKRIEKRRNLKIFLRGIRRKSGYDSGEQGSDSSLSSDDCRSVKTTISYQNAFPRKQLNKIDESLLRRSIKETDIYNDCTDIIKQNTLRNVIPVPPKSLNKQSSHIDNSKDIPKESDNLNGTMTLKDRFTKGFLLPSQRFNKSKLNVPIDKSKNDSIVSKTTEQIANKQIQNINTQSHSDEDHIFPEKAIRGNGNLNLDLQRKRLLDEEDSISERKRSKIDKDFVQCGKRNEESHSDFDDNDFMFKKPSMPVRKSNKTQKHNDNEVVISKSSQSLTQNFNHLSDNHPQNLQDLDTENNNQTVISQNGSDISMKPSFIKRKLFTQKLDLLENKNLNNDNLAAPSPQTKSNVCKEKNKTRKLVTSQSCLSRDVVDDENNVLDLIHKIIPAEQMNLTTASNKRTNKSNKVPDDNWDVASIVSQCNSADGSDTYTDEEIFNLHNTVKKKGDNEKKEKIKATKTGTKECKVVLQNVMKSNAFSKDSIKSSVSSSINITTINKGAVSNSVKSFWDTDLESDIEGHSAPAWKQKTTVNQVKEPLKDTPNVTILQPEKKKAKVSMLTVRGLKNKINNKTTQSEVKKPSTSPQKTEVCKELDTVKTKAASNKKPQKQTKKAATNPNESVLNTRSTRNSKKILDCSCCDNTSNDSHTQTNKTKQANTSKTTKIVKAKGNNKTTPKETKYAPKTTVKTRKCKDLQSILNNTQESDSSINISSRSLRSMKRLENSKENIEPKRKTRSWCKNTSVCL